MGGGIEGGVVVDLRVDVIVARSSGDGGGRGGARVLMLPGD